VPPCRVCRRLDLARGAVTFHTPSRPVFCPPRHRASAVGREAAPFVIRAGRSPPDPTNRRPPLSNAAVVAVDCPYLAVSVNPPCRPRRRTRGRYGTRERVAVALAVQHRILPGRSLGPSMHPPRVGGLVRARDREPITSLKPHLRCYNYTAPSGPIACRSDCPFSDTGPHLDRRDARGRPCACRARPKQRAVVHRDRPSNESPDAISVVSGFP